MADQVKLTDGLALAAPGLAWRSASAWMLAKEARTAGENWRPPAWKT